MTTGITIDDKDFTRKFFKLVRKTIPKNGEKGLARGMEEMLEDGKTKDPQCPKDVGDLWGSTAGTVEAKVTPRKIKVTGGFNSKYAKRQHEAEAGEFNYTTTKGANRPGPKFLLSKFRFRKRYIGIAADFIKKSKV